MNQYAASEYAASLNSDAKDDVKLHFFDMQLETAYCCIFFCNSSLGERSKARKLKDDDEGARFGFRGFEYSRSVSCSVVGISFLFSFIIENFVLHFIYFKRNCICQLYDFFIN